MWLYGCSVETITMQSWFTRLPCLKFCGKCYSKFWWHSRTTFTVEYNTTVTTQLCGVRWDSGNTLH